MTKLLGVFYPVVPDLSWIERLAPLGVETIQLRLKDASPSEVDRQIRASMTVCQRYGAQLIVNDYWEAAIEGGADFLHLGQEDLAMADLARIKAAGIKLGVSSHDHAELDIALTAKPDYVALGPIYETKLKIMKWSPQGLDRIRDWKSRLGAIPLCAIGGITPERAPGVMAAGADCVAVVTDFITAADPEARVRQWMAWSRTVRR